MRSAKCGPLSLLHVKQGRPSWHFQVGSTCFDALQYFLHVARARQYPDNKIFGFVFSEYSEALRCQLTDCTATWIKLFRGKFPVCCDRPTNGSRSPLTAQSPADDLATAWLGATPRVAFTSSEELMAAWTQVQSAVSCVRSCVVSCYASWCRGSDYLNDLYFYAREALRGNTDNWFKHITRFNHQ